MNPRGPTEAHFWTTCIELKIDQSSPELTETWATVAKMIAIGVKVGENETTGPHDGHVQLGTALAKAGYSESRLTTLLNAGDDLVPSMVERAVTLLDTQGQQFNWNDAARLVMTKHRNGEQRDQDRAKIARDYYREQYAQQQRV